jgi:sigma-E factor negative regulatory protein RseC
MITEYAQITEIGADRIKVTIRSSSGCGTCTAKAGCGNGILDRWLNPTRTMWLDSNEEYCTSVSVGDEVQIGVEEGAFVRNALSLYLIPILVFLAGAGLGYQMQGELFSVVGGALGLLLGSALVRYLVKRSPYASEFSPQIIEANSVRMSQDSKPTSGAPA